MSSAFMCYYENLAKLSIVANKQTMFLAHMLYRMEWNKESGQYMVNLNSFIKRQILKDIGCESKDPQTLSRQYVSKLVKSGLIKSIGGGTYIVDPISYGGSKYIPKHLRQKKAHLYETRVFTDTDDGVYSSYIITEDGERIDLT